MFAVKNYAVLQPCKNLKFLDVAGVLSTQIATIMKLKIPPTYDYVQMPERRRVRILEKTPHLYNQLGQLPVMGKEPQLMRGPELIHNRIIYGEFAIQAVEGGRLNWNHMESVRTQIVRKMNDKKMFAYYRVDPPWQPVTKHGTGRKLGGGKGSIDRYEIPVKPGRIIIEIGGHCELEEVTQFLKIICGFLPLKTKIVSRKSIEVNIKQEEEIEKMNQNPITFKYGADNNLIGIKKWLSPYDFWWYGKYR